MTDAQLKGARKPSEEKPEFERLGVLHFSASAGLNEKQRLQELALLQQKVDSLDTELKRTKEAELAAKRLAAVIESSDDAIIFKDLNGVIKTWNKGAERIFGYSAEEAVGKPVTILIPEDRLDEEPGILARIREGKRVDHYETIRRRKDGKFIHISLTVSPVKDDDGKIIGASKIARDITEQKRNEQVIRQQAALFDQAYDAMLVWQWNGAIIYWNRSAERLYGFPRGEAIGTQSHNLLRTHARVGLGVVLARLEQDGIWEGELDHTTREGQKLVIESRMVLIRGPGQSYVLETNRDITARKYFEQKLVETMERERAASRTKDDFLAMVSHELRTPLSPVLLLASDSAANPQMPAEARDHFKTILDNIETEVRLIDDLLDVSRITHGKLNLKLAVADAHAILEEAVATVRDQIDEKDVRLILNLNADQHRIPGDPVRLQQIFWNVLKNAAKFTPKGGAITVETASEAEEKKFILRIADTGIGMTPKELERIFSAFEQGEQSARYGGLGLGLTISKRLVDMHSGSIRATSEGRGKGSAFTIELPLV